MKKPKKLLARVSKRAASAAGSPIALVLALSMVFLWAATGPLFGFSDTWQLVINTSTTITTFLLAISIQYTQNKDARSLHLKLNELLNQNEELQEALAKIEKELEEDE